MKSSDCDEPDSGTLPMRNLRLTIAYDGTNYVGWQIQPNGVSIQSCIEHAIERMTGSETKLLAAGRTDSGVHALGQVANFRTASTIDINRFRSGLQHYLPDDIVIRDVCQVSDEFHATYSALRKRYRYIILNQRNADVFVRRYAWNYHSHLDINAMHRAAEFLIGTHDFRCFESHFPNKATSVRTVFEAQLVRTSGWHAYGYESIAQHTTTTINADTDDAAGTVDAAGMPNATDRTPGTPFVCFDIVADGFLYNMVRTIVGTLIKIGIGSWPVDAMPDIIDRQDRSRAGETAPAHGLYLVRVDYGDAP